MLSLCIWESVEAAKTGTHQELGAGSDSASYAQSEEE